MYAPVRRNGHDVWKEQWYALMLKISLRTDLYMTQKDQVFVGDVVVTDLTWETMVLNVIT
jgi:hypothetical protein